MHILTLHSLNRVIQSIM